MLEQSMKTYPLQTRGIWHEAEARLAQTTDSAAGRMYIIQLDGVDAGHAQKRKFVFDVKGRSR
ncbi:hypothetical protein D3C87_1431900 [compost metagenome]